jgi:erythritol kinase
MIFGLDAGTSVVKAVAFADDGDVVAVASRPTRTINPAPGRAEQDIEQLIAAAASALRELAAAVDGPPDLLGVTGQGDGLWLLDERGYAVRPGILWSDARAAHIVDNWVRSGLAADVFRRTANMTFPGAAAPLLAAIRQEEPNVLARAATAAYCKDVIVQRLTGHRATDVTDASLPFLDLRARAYDPTLLQLVGLTGLEPLLPPIDSVPGPLRPLSREGSVITGLPQSTLVHAGPFDLCATVIGAGVRRPGDGLVILGTTLGCSVLLDQLPGDTPPAGMTLCMPSPDRWVRVMPAMVGTPSLEWVLSLVGAPLDDLDDLLLSTAPGAGGVLALPFLSAAGERAPFVDPHARGALLGLSLETTRARVVRAVCEGIAYAARHCLDQAGLGPDAEVFICGGGSRSLAWRQILADILGRPLQLARQPEVGARGAAMAALTAAGRTFDDQQWTHSDGIVQPNPDNRHLYDRGFAVYLDRVAASQGHWSGPALDPDPRAP